jgi:hypothetical protein
LAVALHVLKITQRQQRKDLMAKAEVKPITPEWLAPFVEAEIGETEYRKCRRKKRAEGIEDALITSHIVDDSTKMIFGRLTAGQREQLLAEAPELPGIRRTRG